MKRNLNDDYEIVAGKKIVRDGKILRVGLMMMDHRTVGRNATKLTDAAGRAGLHLNRPGYRCLLDDTIGNQAVTEAHREYLKDLQNAWKHPVGLGSVPGVATGVGQQGARGAGKEDVVPDAPKASRNDAMPVDDIETAYRLYLEEISQAWKTPG